MTTVEAPRNSHLHPAYRTAPRLLRVAEIVPLTESVKHFRFTPTDGTPLIPFQPGSHVIVTAGDHRNAYSLVDDGLLPTSYGISVLRRGEGGGSDRLHDHLAVGDEIEVEGPRSMFAPVADQHHALLVAGGIGVTPILSHARAAVRDGGTADVLYSYRPGHAAHLTELRELAERPGITLHEATGVPETTEALTRLLRHQPLGTHAYACGPAPMLETYRALAAGAGWPAARVHLEMFAAPEQDPGEPFTVTLTASGRTVEVPSGVSALQSLLDAGVAVPNMCRQGVCGECRIPVTGGEVVHRDFVLTEEERTRGDSMLCCVSRGSNIEVPL
ncbi:MAG: PDR/VanB family oxidoreductase [Gordonia sp. (in: high G+C Gram-positive bacteria)]|uniref:PDR/VanB family oxidoreductase n=1 Tax=Gordonia sp. (in: high G+C Gram-positive bacteria) TaxID=84139 RepID=UPI0039E58564